MRYKSQILILLLLLSSNFYTSCGNVSTQEKSKEDELIVENHTVFRNPILQTGPDPWVYKDRDEYFVTFTTGNNITLIRTNKMSSLKNAKRKVVWTPPATGLNSKQIWAPELHKIDNKWYVYYAASNGDNSTHRMWVLENTSSDPFQGDWVDKGELKLPDNKWAIDGSPFKLNGQYYFVWSGWEGDSNGRQDIYIAKMENPLNVVGERVCLLKPTDPWETNNTDPIVVEGPQFLIKNNRVFIFYSAGACWKDGYSIGAITMTSNSDPMDLNSWQRMDNNPLFVSNVNGNVFGPGHNSFFKSLNNDEDWILYHANPQSDQGCKNDRSMRMQKISWDSESFPVLGSPEPLTKSLNLPSGE